MAFFGLLLAAIGLEIVQLYLVSRRTREIGLRVALGAAPGGILKLVMRQSAALLLVTCTALSDSRSAHIGP